MKDQPGNISAAWSARLANASFLFAVFVVMIHTWGYHPKPDVVVEILRHWFPGFLRPCAVPFFFFVSGFMIARHCHEDDWLRTALRKRVRTLIVPYVALNILFYALLLAAAKFAGTKCGISPLGAIGLSFSNGPAVAQLWYVRELIVFIVCLPLTLPLVRQGLIPSCCLAVSFVFLWIAGEFVFWGNSEQMRFVCSFVFSLNGFAYFIIGAWCAICGGLPELTFRRRMVGLLIYVCCLVGTWCVRRNCPALTFLFIPGLIWGTLVVLPSRPWPKILVRNAFPIFAFHTTVWWFVVVLLRRFDISTETLIGHFWFWTFGMCFNVFVPIALAEFLRRNRYLRFLFLGGR